MTQSLYKRSNLTEYTSRAHHGCQITVYKWKHPRSCTPCNALQVMSGRQLMGTAMTVSDLSLTTVDT